MLFSTDLLFGTGLRRSGATPNSDHIPAYTTVNLGVSHSFDVGGFNGLTARLDLINAFDEKYEIRDGTGVGALDLTQGQLNFLDSETLDNAAVNYLGVFAPSLTPFSVIAGQTLTLGPHLAVSSNGLGQGSIDGPGVIVNVGTLNTPALPGSMLIGGDFVNDGSMSVGFSLEIAGDLLNNGTLGPLGFFTSLVADHNLVGDGTITLQNFHSLPAGHLQVDGTIEGDTHIVGPFGGAFSMTAATIDPTVTVSNFNVGSMIDLTGAPYEGSLTTVTYVDGLLTLKDGNTVEDLFQVPGLPNTARFSTQSDGATSPGTDIITSFTAVACFVSGTRIRTEHGEVAVEHLRVGDMVPVVRAGGTLPIIWIGHRRLRIDGHPRPLDMYPVRVSAGAFADFVPMRDLWLSPEHAVFLHGVLVPVGLLVNDSSIVQVPCSEVTYWHVELASHDLMLCEGAWTESYLDMGNRSAFEENDGPMQLHPDFSRESWEARACQQQERGGPVVEAIRRTINARVGNARVAARAEAA